MHYSKVCLTFLSVSFSLSSFGVGTTFLTAFIFLISGTVISFFCCVKIIFIVSDFLACFDFVLLCSAAAGVLPGGHGGGAAHHHVRGDEHEARGRPKEGEAQVVVRRSRLVVQSGGFSRRNNAAANRSPCRRYPRRVPITMFSRLFFCAFFFAHFCFFCFQIFSPNIRMLLIRVPDILPLFNLQSFEVFPAFPVLFFSVSWRREEENLGGGKLLDKKGPNTVFCCIFCFVVPNITVIREYDAVLIALGMAFRPHDLCSAIK